MLRILTIVGLVYLVNPISAAKEFSMFQEKGWLFDIKNYTIYIRFPN